MIHVEMVRMHLHFSFYYFYLFKTCILFYQQSKDNPDLIEIIVAMFSILYAFAQIFVFCDFGQTLSNRFTEVYKMIYYCDWYELPRDIQRGLLIMQISSQQSVALTGYANLDCKRQSFKKAGIFIIFYVFLEISPEFMVIAGCKRRVLLLHHSP